MPLIVINRCCPAEVHNVWKTDRAVFIAKTTFLGWQEQADGLPFELRGCNACHSTLSDGTVRVRRAEVAHVA